MHPEKLIFSMEIDLVWLYDSFQRPVEICSRENRVAFVTIACHYHVKGYFADFEKFKSSFVQITKNSGTRLGGEVRVAHSPIADQAARFGSIQKRVDFCTYF